MATKEYDYNEVPVMLKHRLLSFRAYDRNGMMLEAVTEQGMHTTKVIEQILKNNGVEYIHIHNSSPGCYDCEVRRVE